MKPLLISDCDEVLLSWAEPFGEHLAETHGLTLSLDSFALSGNIRRADGTAVADEEVPGLLDHFFAHGMHRQRPAPGVVGALERLSAHYDIVILTNIEARFRSGRRDQLAALGMHYEVFTNRGPKGPALKRLLGDHGDPPAVFIDDLPPHLGSARAEVPHLHLVHMVGDERLRGMIPKASSADARIDSWAEAEPYLARLAPKLMEEKALASRPATHEETPS